MRLWEDAAKDAVHALHSFMDRASVAEIQAAREVAVKVRDNPNTPGHEVRVAERWIALIDQELEAREGVRRRAEARK